MCPVSALNLMYFIPGVIQVCLHCFSFVIVPILGLVGCHPSHNGFSLVLDKWGLTC